MGGDPEKPSPQGLVEYQVRYAPDQEQQNARKSTEDMKGEQERQKTHGRTRGGDVG